MQKRCLKIWDLKRKDNVFEKSLCRQCGNNKGFAPSCRKNDEILYCDLEGKEFSVKNYENEYEFLSFIKEGGFAQVYLAKHVLRGNLVAIKKTQIAKLDSESLYSISREALYLSTLRHKNIIKIYSSYLTDNASATCSEIAEILGLQASRSREYLSKMIKEGVLESEGANRNRRYRLKK